MIYDLLNSALVTLDKGGSFPKILPDGSIKLTYPDVDWRNTAWILQQPIQQGTVVQFLGVSDAPSGARLTWTYFAALRGGAQVMLSKQSGRNDLPFEVYGAQPSLTAAVTLRLDAKAPIANSVILIRELYVSIGERVTLEQARALVFRDAKALLVAGIEDVRSTLDSNVQQLRAETQALSNEQRYALDILRGNLGKLSLAVQNQSIDIDAVAIELEDIRTLVNTVRADLGGRIAVLHTGLLSAEAQITSLLEGRPELVAGIITSKELITAGLVGLTAEFLSSRVIARKPVSPSGLLIGIAASIGTLAIMQRGKND